jgi:hypothetical protein
MRIGGLLDMSCVEVDCKLSAIDRTDITNVLMNNYRTSEVAIDSESKTINTLHELHIKVGGARQQHYARRQRRNMNQHNTGTIGR